MALAVRMRAARRLAIAALAVVLGTAGSACATYSDKTEAARAALERGDYPGSIKQWNKILEVHDADALPSEWKKEHALVVLERGMVLQAMQEYQSSAKSLGAAEKQLEFLDIARDGAGKLGKYVYSDSATKYKTSPTEKLSLNAINLVNYLAQGDLGGAKVEAKRFTVMRTYLRDFDPEHEHGAFGSYLAGFVHERLGNYDEALRYYDEALQQRELPGLAPAIQRCAVKGSYRTERLDRYLGGAPLPAPPTEAAPSGDVQSDDVPQGTSEPTPAPIPVPAAAPAGAAEVFVIIKTGRVPYKVPRRIPIGAAIGLAGAYVTGDTTLLEHSAMKVVVFPDLEPAGNLFEDAAWSIDGQPIQLDLVSDLGAEITHEFEQIKPKIIGSAITRMIVRAAAAEGARAAGNQANGAVGLIGALALEATLVAVDKPDTRSWTLLPDRVFIGRAMVPAGEHGVDIVVFGNGGEERRSMQVNVGEGGYVVLDVTTLR